MTTEHFWDEYGLVEQICEAEKGEEIIRDRETGECLNKNRSCDDCPWYREEWNHKSYINGLEWILQDDKFGFGENWKKGSKPCCEEENAGYIITRVIEYLEKLYDEESKKHKNIGLEKNLDSQSQDECGLYVEDDGK